MTTIVIPVSSEQTKGVAASDKRVQVMVNIQAEVLDAESARRKANVWLLDRVGNLLGATTPELVLGERLFWRYDLILGTPNLEQPGTGNLQRVGQILLDAVTGEVQNSDLLMETLQQYGAAIAC